MELIIENFGWMSWNVFLALLGFAAGYGVMRASRPTYKSITAVLFILFVPNTIYMVTDLIHVPRQLAQLYGFAQVLLLVQYAVLVWLALVTYLKSMQWFEQGAARLISTTSTNWHWYFKRNLSWLMVTINFLAAFGVVMGRVMRTNSWYVITQPQRVVSDVVAVVSQMNLLALILVLGISFNLVYFSLRQRKAILHLDKA